MKNYILISKEEYHAPDGTVQPAGTAVQRILWDGISQYEPEGYDVVPDTGQSIYQPVYPVEPHAVPTSVEKWQLQVVLHGTRSKIGGLGNALDDANAVAAQVGGIALIAWNGASTISRDSPTIAALAPAIGFAPGDVDAAFIAAATIRA